MSVCFDKTLNDVSKSKSNKKALSKKKTIFIKLGETEFNFNKQTSPKWSDSTLVVMDESIESNCK
jgi:hypothetical protein